MSDGAVWSTTYILCMPMSMSDHYAAHARGEIALIIRLAFLVRASRSIIVRCGRVRGLQT